jgi:hypothetical protein
MEADMLNKKTIFKTVIILFILFLLGSCYQMNEPTSGDLSLNATLHSRALGDSSGVWVVGLVVDAAFEDQMIEMMRLYDRDIGQDEEDADDILEDMLTKGAVRFDGGRFFFQFNMVYDGSETGDFVVSGLPADKEYFLYIQVFDQEITSIDDMDDLEADVSMELHYFDPAYYTGVNSGTIGGKTKGWYYFENWDTDYIDMNNPAVDGDVWESGSAPVSNQPFLVKPGEETALDVLLIEDLDV